MTTNLNEIYQAALALPLSDRADLAATLFESVKLAEQHDHSDPWVEELRRRIQKLESGEAQLMDWDDFRTQLEAKYAKP